MTSAAVLAGTDGVPAVATQVLDTATIQAILTQLQRSTLDPATERMAKSQRQGFDTTTAISSEAIAGTASWVVQGLLFLLSIGFAAGDSHAPTSNGTSHQNLVWLVLGVVLAAGVLAGVITLVPRIRRLATQRVRPHLWMRHREYV